MHNLGVPFYKPTKDISYFVEKPDCMTNPTDI